jgi:hypothetical protein
MRLAASGTRQGDGPVRLALTAVVVGAALALSGCGGSATPVGDGASTVPTSPSATPSASASVSATPSDSATPFDRTATPATSSGPLGASTLPKASALGPGWSAYIDSGSAEDGYTGNGTPVVARDVRDVTDALLPFGCVDAAYAAPMPVPLHALEADYRHTSGKHAVGLALDYGTPAAAEAFVAAYEKALRACVPGAGATTVVTVDRAPEGAFANVQKDTLEKTVYRELLVPAGRVVRILDVEGATTPVAPWASIAAAFPPAP